ncbi:MAG TPA: acyl-CoA carboxylase subunit epsilon [Spirillospora sp.]
MTADDRPFLRIVRGDPDPEEIAALVTVLTARARAAAAARDGARSGAGGRRPSRWSDRSRLMRTPLTGGFGPRGAGAWRASALPR